MTSDKAAAMRPTGAAVQAFLTAIPDERRRADAHRLFELMAEITGEPAAMWGPSIVGFGSFHYKYDSGREGDAPLAAFSPRKDNLVVYLMAGYEERFPDLLTRLGPHKTGKSCLYLKRLDGVDQRVLRQLIEHSYRAPGGVEPPTP